MLTTICLACVLKMTEDKLEVLGTEEGPPLTTDANCGLCSRTDVPCIIAEVKED